MKIVSFYEIHNNLLRVGRTAESSQNHTSNYGRLFMYIKYFGFNEKPFTLTPNPRFIFLSKNHKEAFAHLLYGINNHYGFIELIGEVGTGKTTVLRTLLGQLQDEAYRTALITNPCLTGVELLRSICTEFGLKAQSEYAHELLAEINSFLLSETSNGRTVVLVIDESQNLHPAVLEQIRLISNLETESDKLIQIVLAGQPELGNLLERPELRQLNQRIAVRYRLKSMNMLETRAYIRHRLEVAGETGGVSFSLFATRLIYLYTRGVPRMINILCDRTLLVAYGEERRRITSSIVTRAIRELLNVPQRKRLSLVLTGTIILVIMSIALSTNMHWFLSVAKSAGINLPASPVITTPLKADQSPKPVVVSLPVQDQRFLQLKQEILSHDLKNTHLQAFNSIADIWGVARINSYGSQLPVPKTYSFLAAKRNLRVTEFKGPLDTLININMPFFAMTRVSNSEGGYGYAVTSVGKDAVTIAPPLFGSSTLSKNDLLSITTGTYYLVWQNIGKIPDSLTPGSTGLEVRTLQKLLKQAGHFTAATTGIYGTETAKAVSQFQQSVGLATDETVGELTLAALTKFYSDYKTPSLSVTGSSR